MIPPSVGLFATCLVDLMRPSVGFAAVKLLEDAGCTVTVPLTQTCCGQPAYNAGESSAAAALAARVIDAFEGFDYVVAPSGSCASMIRGHYPGLFADDAGMSERARSLAGRTFELVSFLADVLGAADFGPEWRAVATYHDSCSGLREMGIKEQPRKLLERIDGLEIRESAEAEACCGFGGLFCVKYPDISGRMADDKADDILATGADLLLGGDLGCLLNLAGRLKRRGSSVKTRHVAEVLAGMTKIPAIGEGAEED